MFSVVFTKLIGRLVRCYNYTICASPVVSSAAILIYSVFILFFFLSLLFGFRNDMLNRPSAASTLSLNAFLSFLSSTVVWWMVDMCLPSADHISHTTKLHKISQKSRSWLRMRSSRFRPGRKLMRNNNNNNEEQENALDKFWLGNWLNWDHHIINIVYRLLVNNWWELFWANFAVDRYGLLVRRICSMKRQKRHENSQAVAICYISNEKMNFNCVEDRTIFLFAFCAFHSTFTIIDF